MDTPNTRSRRKRELQSGDGSSVTWEHDDQLRQEVMLAASDVPLPLPSPTQRPRPIGSARAVGSTASVGSIHPRKRPCRNLRATLSNPPTTSATTQAADSSGRRLDELLDRFLDISSCNSQPSTGGRTTSTLSLTNTSASCTSASSAEERGGLRRGNNTRRPMSVRINNSRQAVPLGATRSLSPQKKNRLPSPPGSCVGPSMESGDLQTKGRVPRFRPPFINNSNGQRVLRSSPRATKGIPQNSGTLQNPASLRGPPAPFAVPAVSNHPVRSTSPIPPYESENTAPSNHIRPSAASRATVSIKSGLSSRVSHAPPSSFPSNPRVSTPHSIASHSIQHQRKTSNPPPQQAAVLPRMVLENVPSSDGDTSIDSLDLMFENGGDEVEALLAAVDGR